jgi:hypothetical protein
MRNRGPLGILVACLLLEALVLQIVDRSADARDPDEAMLEAMATGEGHRMASWRFPNEGIGWGMGSRSQTGDPRSSGAGDPGIIDWDSAKNMFGLGPR